MHDIHTLDKRGVPGCVVLSAEFDRAAAAQSRALGFAPALVQVPHPIQNRTEAELKNIATESIDVILGLIQSE